MQMPSPTIQQSVSDPNLSKPHISPTRHTFGSKPSSSKFVRRPKQHGRKSCSTGSSLSSVNLHTYDLNDESSNSPYYKGLLDQSLAILDHIAAPHSPGYAGSNHLLSSGHSPYYKGLTDYSLVIGSWSQNHPGSNSLSYESSPYYRGLIDYSLALHGPHREEIMEKLTAATGFNPGQSFSSPPKSKTDSTLRELMTNMVDDDVSFVIEEKPLRERVSEETKAASVLEEIAEKTILEGTELMTKRVDDDFGLVIEEKPLRETETESEAIKVESAFEENAGEFFSEEMELTTKGADDDVGSVIEEKPLRERGSEESKTGSVLGENAEKTILEEMELMTKGVNDDVGLVIEEKPLRERISDASKVGSVLEENAEKTTLEEMALVTNEVDDDVGLVIEEKPLRERVSEASKVESVSEEIAEKTILEEMDVEKEEELKYYGLGGEKQKTLSVSEQTVASELPRKGGGDLAQEKLKDPAEEGNVYQYIWETKYQPMTLGDFVCNRDKALELKALVREERGCSHFIFEGPPSVGKRSMIRALLREVFGADGVQVIEECKDFNLKGEMVDNLQVRIKKSLHHVEVNLSETKGYEKHVIVDLFKETYGKIINNSLPCGPENCQAIVLYEAEKLSIESLLYIKWLLEKYKGCNKVFFCCSDESKLQPVKPLCTTARLSPPSSEEIVKILEYIGKKEEIKLSPDALKKIILRSKNNLRQAIRSLEATCRHKDALEDDDLILTGWEDDILNIAKNIIEEQSPRQLYVIRRKLQSLMIHDVPPDYIYKSLVAELTTLVDDSLRSGVAKLDKDYNKASEIKFETMKQFGHAQHKQRESDERNKEPTKKNALSYLKVEEFIAKFMSWYKNSSEKSNKNVQLIAGT